MDVVSLIALSMGIAWASGINLYAAVFMLGYLGATGYIILPDSLQILADPLVMTAAAVMYCIEFFADKIPGIDSGWDSLHTFIRIPAGAMLAAGAVGDISPAIELAAGLLGGSLAAVSHAAKAGGRLLLNASPEPFSNWGSSITEDVLVIAGLWLAIMHPFWFLAALAVFIVFIAWLLSRLWLLLKTVIRQIGNWCCGEKRDKNKDTKPSSLTTLTIDSRKTEH